MAVFNINADGDVPGPAKVPQGPKTGVFNIQGENPAAAMPDVAPSFLHELGESAKQKGLGLAQRAWTAEKTILGALDPRKPLAEKLGTAAAVVDEASNLVVPMVAQSLVMLGARANAAWDTQQKTFQGPDIKNGQMQRTPEELKQMEASYQENRRIADESSRLAQEAAARAVTSPGKQLLEKIGLGRAAEKAAADVGAGVGVYEFHKVMGLVTEAQDSMGQKVAEKSAGRVSNQEFQDALGLLMSGLTVYGGFKGALDRGETPKPPSKVADEVHEDMEFLAEKAKYKAAHGSEQPLQDAIPEMIFHNIEPEHQKAMQEDMLKGLQEAEARKAAVERGEVPPKDPGESLRKVAQAYEKAPEERTQEERTAVRSYFTHEDTVPKEAKEALEASMLTPDELSKKQVELLKKYAPIAVGTTLGLAAWMTQDDSDPAKGLGMAMAGMAVGVVPELRRGVETIEDLRREMDGPSLKFLETLPDDTTHVTRQQIQQHLNTPGVAGVEKDLLRAVAEKLPEKGKVPVRAVLDHLGPTLAEWALEPKEVTTWADYGLENIQRYGPAGNKTVLWQTDPDLNPIRVPEKIGGVDTRLHFAIQNVFGHTRRFFAEGVKHIFEVQSDAFQKLLAAAKEPGAAGEKARQTLEDLKDSTERALKQSSSIITRALIKLTDSGANRAVIKGTVQQELRMAETILKDYYPAGAKRVADMDYQIHAELTTDSLMTTLKHIQRELPGLQEKAMKALEGHDPLARWQAVSDRLRPMQKLFSRRLLREEFAETARTLEARKAEKESILKDDSLSPEDKQKHVAAVERLINQSTHVMVASADTVAKIEGWKRLAEHAAKEGIPPEKAVPQLQKDLQMELKKIEAAKELVNEGEATEKEALDEMNATQGSLDDYARYVQRHIDHLERFKDTPIDEKGPFLDPGHQGIYDRYKKETEPFLRSLGAEVVNDAKTNPDTMDLANHAGYEWFKVPVVNRKLGLGPRAHMAGFADPKMVAILAGGALGAWAGYSYQHKLGTTLLGAMLGLGAVAGGARLFTKSLQGTQAAKAAVKELSDMLYAAVQGGKADGLDLIDYIRRGNYKNYAKHSEEIAQHLDNPKKHAISPEGAHLLRTLVIPIQKSNHAMVLALEHLGVSAEDLKPGQGARRFLQGTTKGLLATLEEGGRVGSVRANTSLSSTVKGSTDAAFHKFSTPSGKSFVGKLGEKGDVEVWKNGEIVGKAKFDHNKQQLTHADEVYKASRPTMDEVEQHTTARYHKDALLGELDANLRLRVALSNAYTMNRLRQMPGFSSFAFKPAAHDIVPEGWKGVRNFSQMRDWKFEPRIAEVLEDFLHDTAQDRLAALGKINRVLVGSMFFTPFLHIGNVAVHALQEKGLVGLVVNSPLTLRTAFEAYKEVASNGVKYRAYLREGGGFMYPDRQLREFTGKILEGLGKDPKGAMTIARAFGEANPLTWLKRLHDMSGDALWKWNDIFIMQGYLEKEARGMSREAAMRATEQHIPNYRIPSRVLGSRELSKILQSNFLSFARYDYGRLASYGSTLRDLLGKDKSLGERAHALDQMAMLGVIMIGYSYLGDEVAKWITGNKDASMMRLGSATIPQMITDAWTGEADKRAPVANLFHVSPVFELIPQLTANTNLYTRQDLASTPKELGGVLAGQLSPVRNAQDVLRDKNPKSVEEVFWAQLGLKDPTPEEVEKKDKRKQKRLDERTEP